MVDLKAFGEKMEDDESKWKGKNWLGKVLDEVRTKLLNGYTSNLEYAE